MIELKPDAVLKIREIMEKMNPIPQAVRISVIGGGCSGFQYDMKWEDQVGALDKTYQFNASKESGEVVTIKVIVDQASLLYLDGVKLDYVETLEGAGFKFENPNVKSTCGCGSSFQV